VGLFITFEGLDGSGKSTQARFLYEELKKRRVRVLLTREPGGTRIGEQIRETLHSTANVEMLPATEILLYSASRAQLVGESILPRLAEGFVVLCDRYVDSTYAYQGYGHGLDLAVLQHISKFATCGLRPDLIVYLDLDVEVGLARRHNAHQSDAGELNRMDQQAVEFYQRVRQGYFEMIANEPQQWRVIEASPPSAVVYESVRKEVLPVVDEWLNDSSESESRAN
jgi:dTMP kinase